MVSTPNPPQEPEGTLSQASGGSWVPVTAPEPVAVHSEATDDADSLRWDGDEDAKPTLPSGWRAVGRGADDVLETPVDAGETVEGLTPAATASTSTAEAGPLNNAALLSIGVLAGVYLLYTVGWFLGAARIQYPATWLLNGGLSATDSAVIGTISYEVLRWGAILAPAVWFGVVFVLTRHARSWVRFAWLAAGAVLLIPWPLLANFATVGASQ